MRRFLDQQGASISRISGGHEIWTHPDINRPIPLQTHIDPVPEFITNQILDYFNITIEQWHLQMGKTKGSSVRSHKTSKRGKRSGKK
ncbi:MAG: hypothetical protein KDC12_10840 [Flavobacteriales bacterium]|nr:hypothetical protein [Flavobacteriales bacterium]